ncbi:MAG: HEPN domain-containing protein [Thermoleophilia bacterium]|nr:HEPN domain-containing protein [Thermoleophilia bacterium]
MSPRSEEFMAMARERLDAARLVLEAGFEEGAVSAAYYAMLYAARAALSEEDRNARTHRGTWQLFRETFVEPGRFDADLVAAAQRAQGAREGADYDARRVSAEDAERLCAVAERFVAAIDELAG